MNAARAFEAPLLSEPARAPLLTRVRAGVSPEELRETAWSGGAVRPAARGPCHRSFMRYAATAIVNPRPPSIFDPFATPDGVLSFVPKKRCFTEGLSRNT